MTAHTVRPLPQELDTMAAHAYWYIAGRIATLMWLDGVLSEIAAKADIPSEKVTPADIMAGLMQVDTLCREGLQKDRRDRDVADMIDLQQMDAVTRRIRQVGGIINKLKEAGREKGARW